MRVISYDQAVKAAPYRLPGYLDDLLESGTPVTRQGNVVAIHMPDDVYKKLADKYKIRPACQWDSKPLLGQYLHKCRSCGRAVVNDSSTPPEGTCTMPIAQENVPPGVGSQIKSLLGRMGIKASKGCGCNKKAKDIDRLGLSWAKKNKDKIVSMLQEEASKRSLPFSRTAATGLVNLAIWTAPRKGNP